MPSALNGNRALHVAVTSHGYGHLSRALALVAALRERHPAQRIVISSMVDPKIFGVRAADDVTWREQMYEPGLAQRDWITVDESQTRQKVIRFHNERAERLAVEIDFLRQENVAAVIADVPALPLAAARTAGIPAIALWNFTWSWMLKRLFATDPELKPVIAELDHDYASAALHLRCPFSDADDRPGPTTDIPLLGHRATVPREDVRRRLGVPANEQKPLVFVSMGGWYGLPIKPLVIRDCAAFHFLLRSDLPFSAPDSRVTQFTPPFAGLTFADVTHAADVVVSKAGYGTASDCILNRIPLLFLERHDSPETQILDAQLNTWGPCQVFPQDDFFAGQWERHLMNVLNNRVPWREVPGDAARTVAHAAMQALQ